MNLKGSLPNGTFQDQELLDIAYDVLLSEMIPLVLAAREDYLVFSQDFAITASQTAYPVPSRALNGILREVKLIRGGTDIINLTRQDVESITTLVVGTPTDFYMQANNVCLYPTPSTTLDVLRLFYFIRPSKLVPVASCGQITGISGNTVNLTIPPTWTTSNTFDLVRGRAHFDIQGIDLVASSVAGGAITFTSTLPSTLVVGDWVTLSEETCFPYLPPELHIALVQGAVTVALESMADPNAPQSAQKAERLMTNAKSVLDTRVVGEAKALGTRLL